MNRNFWLTMLGAGLLISTQTAFAIVITFNITNESGAEQKVQCRGGQTGAGFDAIPIQTVKAGETARVSTPNIEIFLWERYRCQIPGKNVGDSPKAGSEIVEVDVKDSGKLNYVITRGGDDQLVGKLTKE